MSLNATGFEFLYTGVPDREFLEAVVATLAAEGLTLTGPEEGMVPHYLTIDPTHEETWGWATAEDAFEPFAREAVERYRQSDPAGTELSLSAFLQVPGDGDPEPSPVRFSIVPAGPNYRLELELTGTDLQPDRRYEGFRGLARRLFEGLDLVYGVSRREYDRRIPATPEELAALPLDNVVFYAAPLVERVGRERLQTAPVEETVRLAGGGLMLVVARERFQSDRVRALRDHLYGG